MPNIPPPKYHLTHLNKIVYGVSFFLPTFMSIRYVSQFNHFVSFVYKVFHFLSFKGLTGSYLNFPRSLSFKDFLKINYCLNSTNKNKPHLTNEGFLLYLQTRLKTHNSLLVNIPPIVGIILWTSEKIFEEIFFKRSCPG